MSKKQIPLSLRRRVEQTAQHRYGYCWRTEEIMGMPMEIEHIIPEVVGGATTEENLWLACRRCNQFKGAQTHALDPVTGRRVRLFNPRKQKWKRHFKWSADGTEIIGKTAVGRATVVALKMNHPVSIRARQKWVLAGWWPPED
jgi:5-methylcytosine-specific restriction endonuclease McrA